MKLKDEESGKTSERAIPDLGGHQVCALEEMLGFVRMFRADAQARHAEAACVIERMTRTISMAVTDERHWTEYEARIREEIARRS